MSLFVAALGRAIDLVHVRHEAAAVHMADAGGRLTGEPGVAMVTGGPGHANAVGALFTALGAESPMVLLSGHAATWELGRGGFQEARPGGDGGARHQGFVDGPLRFDMLARRRRPGRSTWRARAGRGRWT